MIYNMSYCISHEEMSFTALLDRIRFGFLCLINRDIKLIASPHMFCFSVVQHGNGLMSVPVYERGGGVGKNRK